MIVEKEKNIYNLRKMPYMLKDGGNVASHNFYGFLFFKI